MVSSAATRELLVTAAAAAEQHDWAAAAALLADARPTDDVLKARAWYLSRAKRYEDALEILKQRMAQDPDSHLPYYMIGYQYYEQGRYAEALPWFDAALERHPTHLKSHWRRANALRQVGQHTKAQIAAGQVLRLWHQLGPEDQQQERVTLAKASYLLGRAQLRTDPASAIPLLEQAVRHDPADPYKHYGLGKAFCKAGHPHNALSHLKRARRIKPGDLHIELQLAAALVATGESHRAIKILRRLRPRCRDWQAFKAGKLALHAGQQELAVALLRRASKDRGTKGDPKVQQVLEEALAASTEPTEPSADTGDEQLAAASAIGTVDVIRAELGFGFLVDDQHGTRRHFRLPRGVHFAVGSRVTFIPFQAAKGPAAHEVRHL
jgi:tetratricopeptide (TPR) repeat protein